MKESDPVVVRKQTQNIQNFHIHPHQRKKVVRGNAFVSRPSRLDLRTLLSEDNPMRGFFTLFWIAMTFYTATTLYQNWRKEGVPLRLNFFFFISEDWIVLILSDFCLIFSCFMCVSIVKLFLGGWIPKAAIFPLQHLWQFSWFAACVYWVFHRDWPWVQSGFFVMHAIVMLMKQHSYLATNIEFMQKLDLLISVKENVHKLTSSLKRKDEISEDDSTSDTSYEEETSEIVALKEEIEQLEKDLNRPSISFPENVTHWNFWEYVSFPILVYDLEYPRTNMYNIFKLIVNVI
ncbi:hypothetical protein HK096_009246 [Nowakowskiella sp. JEL0078]|nr:hypothetical protein HK096_009246 [Nowakowskiella sp. JEL0078]